ncbi:MAG: site-specific integrase [Holophagales bacterium]|nr:site-specific integrase [Holophagales bacterium]
MTLYKRGRVWWYEFGYEGARIRESTRTRNRRAAEDIESARRAELARSGAGVTRKVPVLFENAAREYIGAKALSVRPRTLAIEAANLQHLLPAFGRRHIHAITAEEIASYQARRLAKEAAPKTVTLEIGTLRAILRRSGFWAALQPNVPKLRLPESPGKALTREEEKKLLAACKTSRSQALPVALVVALETGLRLTELTGLTWERIDFARHELVVGASKTEAGARRRIPLSQRAEATLDQWSARFPDRKPEHYVFPTERYGATGKAYDVDPTTPMHQLKTGWKAAQTRAGLELRWHDLRHSWVSRLLESGTSFPIVAALAGWSPATSIRMARVYGHLSMAPLHEAIERASRYVPPKRRRKAVAGKRTPQKSPHRAAAGRPETTN